MAASDFAQSFAILCGIALVVWGLYRMASAENREKDQREQELLKRVGKPKYFYPLTPAEMSKLRDFDKRHPNPAKEYEDMIHDKCASDTSEAPGRDEPSGWRGAPSAHLAKEAGARAAMVKGKGWGYETRFGRHGNQWRLVPPGGKVELAQPADDQEQFRLIGERLKQVAPTWPLFHYEVNGSKHYVASWVPYSHGGIRYKRMHVESMDEALDGFDETKLYPMLASAASQTIRLAKPIPEDKQV